MIDHAALLADLKRQVRILEDDLRAIRHGGPGSRHGVCVDADALD